MNWVLFFSGQFADSSPVLFVGFISIASLLFLVSLRAVYRYLDRTLAAFQRSLYLFDDNFCFGRRSCSADHVCALPGSCCVISVRCRFRVEKVPRLSSRRV